MILTFGKFKGCNLEEVDEEYLCWLAKPNYNSHYYKNQYSDEHSWKVPFEVKIAARKVLDNRGWKLQGETWIAPDKK
jgi:hypothetical protein